MATDLTLTPSELSKFMDFVGYCWAEATDSNATARSVFPLFTFPQKQKSIWYHCTRMRWRSHAMSAMVLILQQCYPIGSMQNSSNGNWVSLTNFFFNLKIANTIVNHSGQKYFMDNRFGMLGSNLYGLFTLLADPKGLEVLDSTGRSSTPETAKKRYVSTIVHMLSWYEVELRPGSKYILENFDF